MNAFHPEFIKTHYPDLLKDHITSSKGSLAMTKYVEKKRLEKPNHGTISGFAHTKEILLPKTFAVYSRAGMPK
jgi:hypothetical protein